MTVRKSSAVLWIGALIAVGMLLVAGSVGAADQKPTTVKGTVVATDFNDNGDPVQVAIEADDAEYLVAQDEVGFELLDHIGDTVEATGYITDLGEGTLEIKVISFKVVEEPSET